MIKQIVIISVAVAITVSVICFVAITPAQKLHKQLLENEQRTRDSLSQIYAKFVTKSDSLQAHIDTMQSALDKQIKHFRYDLHRIKIIQIPSVNYSNVTDTLLIGRLLSNYKGR
jgi:peptidoglycan hydrolase CwlO-like protein